MATISYHFQLGRLRLTDGVTCPGPVRGLRSWPSIAFRLLATPIGPPILYLGEVCTKASEDLPGSGQACQPAVIRIGELERHG